MSRRVIAIVLSLFSLTIMLGVALSASSVASVANGLVVNPSKRAGLTQSGIAMATTDRLNSVGFVRLRAQTSLLKLKQATALGPHAPNARMELTVSLKLRNVGELKRFLKEVQNPGSPAYHQFLTPRQFTSRYGPTQAQVADVSNYLKAQGIKITGVSPNRMLIHTQARTVDYEHALRIMVNDYRLDGRRFYSTESAPQLPANIAAHVLNIIGLDNAVRMHPMSHIEPLPESAKLVTPNKGRGPPAPPPATSAHYNPLQIQQAYDWPNITNPANGAGVTIAILTANSSDLSARDFRAFWGIYRLAQHNVTIIPVGADEGKTNGTAESLLDIEWSGAMSPGAALNVYVTGNASLAAFTDMYSQFVNDNSAQVMTTSWGLYEMASPSSVQTDEQIFMQAAAQGISMFAAAGDRGASDGTRGDNMADYPSSSAYITSANGTQLRADVNGNYIGETAWNGTGGAISQLIEQPTWQTGPGVPANGWRNNSDIAMNAGPRWPYMFFHAGDFGTVYGTSAVAPQLAGLFAIAISRNGGQSLGQSNKLLYGVVHAGYYTTDYRDVTLGTNGIYKAGVNWDHPTGWGSPLATSLIGHLGVVGPTGTLTGTVSNTATGDAVAGAIVTITPGGFHKTTRQDGTYSIILPAGSYTATATAFGYAAGSQSVVVDDQRATTADVALTASARVTLAGAVKDGSGHGYGLYAAVRVSTDKYGRVAVAWTNPTTGAYSLRLPAAVTYHLNVVPAVHGYESSSASVTLNATETKDFSLPVIAACTAPGYGFASGFGEDFNGSFPPTGWTVTNEVLASPYVWKTNVDEQQANWTGGTGMAAAMKSVPPAGQWGYGGPFASALVTPPIAVSSLPASPLISFRANFVVLDGDALDLDVSADGGPWQNVLHWTTRHGTPFAKPGVKAGADLSAYTQGAKSIRLRWRYYDLADGMGFDFYAQVDDVVIGRCEAQPGGLVFGQVIDANTRQGVVGASVTGDQGNTITTLVNPLDAKLPVGAYLLFLSSGDRTLSATEARYATASAEVHMGNNDVLTHNFALDAGHFETAPALQLDVPVGLQSAQQLIIKNDGSAAVNYHVLEVDLPPSPAPTADSFAPASHYLPQLDPLARSACENGCPIGLSEATLAGLRVMPASAGIVTFPAGMTLYGLGVDRNAEDLWLGSPAYNKMRGDGKDHRFLFDGSNTGESIDLSSLPNVVYMADMAFDDVTGMLWQVSLDTGVIASHIYQLDPKTMQPTGVSIKIPSPQNERGLAFDPLTDTWYAGDFRSGTIYHFNALGKLLDSAFVKLPIQGLAYNSGNGHLYVLTSAGAHSIIVLDAWNDYAPYGYIDIPGFDSRDAAAGLDYDCDGNLWISTIRAQSVWKVNPGESGWCAFKGIPWLTVGPADGSLPAGGAVALTLAFDGSGHQAGATSQVQLRLRGNTPYPVPSVPLTVNWVYPPANLALNVVPSADAVIKGEALTYHLSIKNPRMAGHGDASGVQLTYTLPNGLSFVSAAGEGVTCTHATADATTITCNLGSLARGEYRSITMAVKSKYLGNWTGHFEVLADQPIDSGKNIVQVTTSVTAKGSNSNSGSGGGGGGALGWMILVMLTGLALGGIYVRRRRRA